MCRAARLRRPARPRPRSARRGRRPARSSRCRRRGTRRRRRVGRANPRTTDATARAGRIVQRAAARPGAKPSARALSLDGWPVPPPSTAAPPAATRAPSGTGAAPAAASGTRSWRRRARRRRRARGAGNGARRARARARSSRSRSPTSRRPRSRACSTGIGELDRVLGGGLVPGSLVLIGGSPGIGKSTLTSGALGNLAAAGHKVLYVSGEESAAQVKLRAERLGGQRAERPDRRRDRPRRGARHARGRAPRRLRDRLRAGALRPRAHRRARLGRPGARGRRAHHARGQGAAASPRCWSAT